MNRKPKMNLRTKTVPAIVCILIFSFFFANGCGKKRNDTNISAYKEEIKKWQTNRTAQIGREDGWLTLAGLFWLQDGKNLIGTDPSSTVIFPAGSTPAKAGTITLQNGTLTIATERGTKFRYQDSLISRMQLTSDESGQARPTVLTTGSVNFYVIKRGDRFGIRMKDKNNPALKNFKGLDFFPANLALRIDAVYKPYPEPKIIEVALIIGTVEKDTCHGALIFKIDKQTYTLDVTSDPETKELYLMFTDETTGKETYGNGRQLSTSPPDEKGKVTLDFNKAINWPCAYTPYATCPIPPKQNHLPVRIEAGEKKYPGATDNIH
jgi:uncharacterized protein (DUF1684 family)